MGANIKAVEKIILSEINVKEIEYLTEDSGVLTKQIKPNFKTLGPKFGKDMGLISESIAQFNSDNIKQIVREGGYKINDKITIDLTDVEISSADVPGYIVSSNDGVTVALDITISQNLKEEGLAREFINRLQNLRKEKNFKVTDRVSIQLLKNDKLTSAIKNNLTYICDEILATKLEIVSTTSNPLTKIELVDSITAKISILKC
jgi:isoleucyl-tRNA synthetase